MIWPLKSYQRTFSSLLSSAVRILLLALESAVGCLLLGGVSFLYLEWPDSVFHLGEFLQTGHSEIDLPQSYFCVVSVGSCVVSDR